MSREIFDRDTLLDLTVNFIPLGILALFIALYVVFNPWGWDPLFSTLQFGLITITFVLLAVLTYLSGKAIEGDERRFGGGEH
ncbi:DUF6684 family protein [Natranaeroarchaeum sulfidigenes]|uniref:Putative membrane protein n=1 Tax=Natranaeroarchaeum sulfidigenes TaxID=2784880 RepID=A0A897MJ56_9EURY|nr:DUF6684 family protein [Natranaeroarchaeum sulfidigenes]QSG02140.1 putative membrane protein [Natranaeroarchaeum sulfidigenes]